MERDSMIIYRSFYEAIKELPMQTQAEVWNAIYELGLNGNLVQLTGMAKTIFTLINPQIEANYKKYMNGKRPKLKQSESKTEAKVKQNGSKTEANVNDNVNDNENINVNKFSFYKYLFEYGFEETLLKDWLIVRKNKKLTNTETSANKFIFEVEKCNKDKNEILQTCVANSWGGFNSQWLQKNQPTSEGISPEEIKARKYGLIK